MCSALLFQTLCITLIGADLLHVPPVKPHCLMQQFSQRQVKYGKLIRQKGSGELSFPEGTVAEKVSVFYRLHVRKSELYYTYYLWK